MVVKTVVSYTNDEIHTMINSLNFLSNMIDNDTATKDMKEKAETAFGAISELICLDEQGEKAYTFEGW